MMHILSFKSARTLSVVCLLLSLAASLPARANIFGSDKKPVPQWGLDAAKIKTPDYAKESNTVVLFDEYVESIDDKGRLIEREREAIRILKPQGRHEGCAMSYDIDEKINYFRAWTIGADEKQYQAQETDFHEEGMNDYAVMLRTRRMKILKAPAAEVGAIIVCETEETMQPWRHEAYWMVQGSTPIVNEALELDLPQGKSYSTAWHSFPEVKPVEVTPNHWRWEIHDVHPIDLRDVPNEPDFGAVAGRVSFRWDDFATAGNLDEQWKTLGAWISNLQSHRADPTPEITAKSQELIAGAPDFYTKLQRITEYIQKSIRYFVVERGIGGQQAHPAAEIFRNHYGDCKDKSNILISMLQAAGINADYVIVDSGRGVVDPADPSLYGNHMITAIEVPANVEDPRLIAIVKGKNGKRYLIFDPTDEHTPVGNMPSNEQGGYGLLSAGADSQILALPVLAPDANMNEGRGTFTLQPDGTLTGSVDAVHRGPAGAFFRMMIKYTDEKERHEYWEHRLADDLPGVVLNKLTFTQPSELNKPLELKYDITAKQYAHQTGPLLLVRPRVVTSHTKHFDEKPRKVQINLGATGHWHETYDITLPAGYVVDELPDPTDVDSEFISYHSKITSADGKLHYERDYQVKQIELPANKAVEFRKVESAILRDEKGTAILKKQ